VREARCLPSEGQRAGMYPHIGRNIGASGAGYFIAYECAGESRMRNRHGQTEERGPAPSAQTLAARARGGELSCGEGDEEWVTRGAAGAPGTLAAASGCGKGGRARTPVWVPGEGGPGSAVVAEADVHRGTGS